MGPESYRVRRNKANYMAAHYAVQGYSRSPISTNRKATCDFLLVINTNLSSILHRFQVLADY